MSLKTLDVIFKMEKVEIERQFTPYFYTYFRSIFEFPKKFEEYSKMCKYIFDITRAKGRRVLDIGCGFGLISIHLAIFGAHRVTGVDKDEEMISVFKKILSRFYPSLNNIEAKLGDALELDYESYDIVIANEVVSHVRDLDLFLSKIGRVLRKGGIFYVSDGNNGLNIFQRYKRRKIWRKSEVGPVEGLGLEMSYSEMREKLIGEKYPQIDKRTLKVLVKETAGTWGQDICKGIEEYLQRGKIMQKPTFKFRNPRTGEYPEFEFNPYKLKKKLQIFGFKAKITRPHFSYIMRPSSVDTFILNVVGRVIILLHPISLIIAPNFTIVAQKT